MGWHAGCMVGVGVERLGQVAKGVAWFGGLTRALTCCSALFHVCKGKHATGTGVSRAACSVSGNSNGLMWACGLLRSAHGCLPVRHAGAQVR